MKTTICSATALILVAFAAEAKDLTWGCSFDKATGRTYCLEVNATGTQNTGRVIVSKPNIGIPGTYQSVDGRKVRVYLGGNGTGYQNLGW